MPTLHLIIPFFNETATLETAVQRVLATPMLSGWGLKVILLDDGSDRSSAEIGEQLAKENEQVSLQRHENNQGKGAAVRSGFSSVIEIAHDDDVAGILDADLEYDPADLSHLINTLNNEQADAIFGNRWATPPLSLKGFLHRMGNRFLTRLSNRATGLHLSDMECCYKIIRIPMLRKILDDLDEDRFGIEPQLAAALARHGAKIVDLPVSYDPRGFDDGKKIGVKDAMEAIRVIRRERARTRSRSQ